MPTPEELLRAVPAGQGPALSVWGDRPPPVGPDRTPPVVGRHEQAISHFQKELGLSREQAAGATLWMDKVESGLDPGAFNPRGGGQGALGIGQWRGPRQQALKEKYGESPSFTQQLQFATDELKGPEKKALEQLRGAKTVDEAYQIWGKEFERPGAVVAGKRALDREDFDRLVNDMPTGGAADSRVGASPSLIEALGAGAAASIAPETFPATVGAPEGMIATQMDMSAALTAGAIKGAINVPLGAAQLLLPSSVMEPVERQYRELVSKYDEVGERHPNMDFAGRLIGSTVAILASARALGAASVSALMPKAVQTGWEAIGTLGRGAATGAAVGGTEFHSEGAPGALSRGIEAAIGATFGLLGGTIAKGAAWAADNLANTTLAQKFLPVLQESANGLTRNSEGPLKNFITHYQNTEKLAATKFNLRNVAGQRFEGFPSGVGVAEVGASEGFAQAIEKSLEASRSKGIEMRRSVETAAARVKEVLGLNKEEGRLGEWKAETERYAKAAAAADAAEEKLTGGLGDTVKGQVVSQLRMQGRLPPRPEEPAPFQPEAVTPESYAQARTAVNAGLRRTRDAAARTQLNMLRNSLDDVAKQTASEYGMGATEFLRRANAANKFFEENVAPLRNFFGGKTATEVAGRPGVALDGMTPAGFYDKIARVIEGDDLTAIRDVAKVLGPKARSDLKMVAASRAIEAGTEGRQATASAFRYVQEHQDALWELLGRDEYINLVGMGKIADSMIHKIRTGDKKAIFDYSHSMGPAFAFYQLIEHHSVPKFVGTLAALPVYHLVLNMLNKVHVGASMTPLVKRAATLKPGSAELAELVGAIERRVIAASVPAERASRP